MKNKTRPAPKRKSPDKDMMEALDVSPWYSVGKILPTSTKKKYDVFDSYRPNRQCVDYKISETWTKMQGGDVKINIRETCATYKDIPPEICKPQRVKKEKLFSGGPPQWKFINEVWGEQMNERQKFLKIEHKRLVREAKAARANRLEREHAIVQRLIGPDWFMELSPKQLQAVDKLRQSVYLDLKRRTTENCQDILASLGLVLRPNKKHVEKALQHCCGCAVEFLLVLYQLIDPKRQSYSLNDRIILSAVVHLSITQTLRELHIRTPSPPKNLKKVKKPKKKVEKVKYESPYLAPLRYEPPPPKNTGIYSNTYKQHPESPYFSYLKDLEAEKRSSSSLNFSMLSESADLKSRITEYKEAQNFYLTLPGVKEQMLNLIYPTQLHLCPNLLHQKEKPPPINEKLVAPHLCKVTSSEPVICFCEENRRKLNLEYKTVKRSCCEKAAQNFLQSQCLCDDCLEGVAQKHMVRIHGGFQKSPCKCDDPVPIIQGTLLNKTCECYKAFRNTVVGAAARQYLTDQKYKYVMGGVAMTKNGPVYQVLTTVGDKICICGDIKRRKEQVRHIQETMWNNEVKFAIGGVTMSKFGPVYNLTAIVARTPCKCLIKYRAQLKILTIQNEVRKNPSCFVNHGLIMGNKGPVYHFSGYVVHAVKSSLEIHEVCSCEIKKPKCFQRCYDYVEYKVSRHTPPSTSSDSTSISEESEVTFESKEFTSSESQSEEIGEGVSDRPCCGRSSAKIKKSSQNQNTRKYSQGEKCPQCRKSSSSESETTSEELDDSKESSQSSSAQENTVSNESEKISDKSEKTSDKSDKISDKSSDYDEFSAPRPCRCKEELNRFMEAKCPCDECNNKIRQGTATYVMGGVKETPSGNQLNVVQGVQQPVCSCMHKHLENIKKIDEYKSRVTARYNLKKQAQKYCICGVKNTPDGPVYIISGLRPPVECECAKAIREKQELEEHEKQRAKLPNTGRIKYEIAGVKAMPNENVFILSRALNIPDCRCEEVLSLFEGAHKHCIKEFERYLELTVNEIKEMDEEAMDEHRRGTLLNMEDLNFGPEQKKIQMGSNSQMGDSQAAINRVSSTYREESKEEQRKMQMDSNVGIGGSPSGERRIESPRLEAIKEESDAFPEIQDEDEPPASSEETKKTRCSCAEESLDSNDSFPSNDDFTSSEYDTISSDITGSSECGSCHVENPPDVRPIRLETDKLFPDSFLSKRFAIFKTFPKDLKTQMPMLRHILQGMAEDGFPLAKLPQVYKLPIFKLWLEMRSEVYWTYEDRFKYFCKSKDLWKHTVVCYRTPHAERLPFTFDEAHELTWKQAKMIKGLTSEKLNNFYRKVKQLTVDAGREFFAPTFSYEFPTSTWRDCAFAYLPAKEEDVFAYKIVKPHDIRTIPENKRMNCYC